MITPRILTTLLLLVVALGGCGPGDAAPLEGGGARGGEIRDALIVFALDERTGAPIEGASVGVGGGAQQTTDADGRAVLALDGGPADVSVSAAGYVTESWLGVDAAELTIPLAPSSALPLGVARAHLEGLDAFVASDPAHRVRATLGATRAVSADPTGPRGALITCAAGDECVRELAVPAGAVRLFAQIDEVDASGRRVAPLGFALSEPVDVAPEATADAALLPLAAASLRELAVAPTAAPSGVDAVVGVPGLSRAGAVIVLAGDEGHAPFLLPAREGDDVYWAVASASREAATTQSITRLAPDDSTESIAPPSLRPLPTATREAASLHLANVEGAAMITITAPGWRARIFDDRSDVALPDPDAPVRVCATEAARSASEWQLADLEHRWTRRACSDP